MDETAPKYVLAQQHIKNAIKDGQYVEKLPGERKLAKELGFSYMTVRKAIEGLVEEGILNKVPTKGTFVSHKNGKNKKTRVIGYFLDSGIKSGVASPYYSLIYNAIKAEAAKNDYTVACFSEANEVQFRKTLATLDGVIASSFPRMEDSIQKIRQSVPVVVIDNVTADKSIPSVTIDNYSATVETIECICGLGHKNIGFMTGLDDSAIGKDRYAGYQNSLAKHGIEFDETMVFRGNYSFESGISGAEYFLTLKRRPTAIICANDSMALGAIQKLTQQGINVPHDISIIGFDDIEVASQVTPALTTVAVPFREIARHSCTILKKLILGEQPEYLHIALTARLVKRQTCTELKEKGSGNLYAVAIDG